MASNNNLPYVSSQIPPDLRQFLERVRETLGGTEFVRRTDYLRGTVPSYPGEPPDPPPPPPPPPPCGNPIAPTAPTGFTVTPGMSGFLLQWDMPGYCGHSHTEVYGLRRDGSAPELDVGNMLGESQGVFYSHVAANANDYWCFWIRHVNVLDAEGAFNAAGGTCARTAIDPKPLLDVLQGQITDSHLYRHLGERIDLIDVEVPVSTLTSMAALSGRVIYAMDPPTNASVDPDLAVGDLWVETDDVYPDAVTINKTYRWTGTAWTLLSRNQINQLSTAILNETIYRADGDTIEASQREGLFAGAFAGIGNAYRYFIQETAPTNATVEPDLTVGDIWARRDPKTDATAVFKRWTSVGWYVAAPQTTPVPNAAVDANRRAAKFLGSSSNKTAGGAPLPPATIPVNGYVIGDQFLYTNGTLTGGGTDPNWNKIFVYNYSGTAFVWQALANPEQQALSAALVYSEKNVLASVDAALASRMDLVYARFGDSRPNLCPDAAFEEFDTAKYVGAAPFEVVDTNYGRALRKAGSFTETGGLLLLPAFAVVATRRYAATANLRIHLGASGVGRIGLKYYSGADGTGSSVVDYGAQITAPFNYGAVYPVTDPATGVTRDYSQRDKLLVVSTAPAGYASARLFFQWTTAGATEIGIARPQVVVITGLEDELCSEGAATDSTIGTCPLPSFNYDSTSALVADVATARIGYCTFATSPTTAETAEYPTRQTCEAAPRLAVAGGVFNATTCAAVGGLWTAGTSTCAVPGKWNVGLPWATAVKQVAVTTADFCVVNGVVDKTKTTAGTCTAAGGVWTPGATATVQQTFEAQQQTNGELYAQYSVKIDNDGYVSGFGLSSEVINGVPFSEFMVRADRFSIAAPASPALQVAVTSLTRVDTTGTCVAATAIPCAVGDRVVISNVAGGLWNRAFTVATRAANGLSITFEGVHTAAPTPAFAAPGKTIKVAKVAVPFVVTTTDSYLYAPAVATLYAADILAMTTAYGLRVSINSGYSTVLCPLPRNGSAGLTAAEVVAAINDTPAAAALVTAAVGASLTSLTVTSVLANATVALRVYWSALNYASALCQQRVTIPAGVYMDDAYIVNAIINWAQIDTATIDWLTVVRQLRANDILAGNISVGTCIGSTTYEAGVSGWRICGGGNAELNNATLRGSLAGGLATAYGVGTGYFLGSWGNAHFGDPAAENMTWDQTAGALTIKGTLRGGAATTLALGTGYFLDSAGNFRVGNPTNNNLTWDQTTGALILEGTARSANWNGTLDAAGVRTGNPGTQGWLIDKAGNAEFGTVHIRKNAATVSMFGTATTPVAIPYKQTLKAVYADVYYPDVDTSGVIITANASLYRVGDAPAGGGLNQIDAIFYLAREWPVASDPTNLVNGGICSKVGYTTSATCLAAGGQWFSDATYCSNMGSAITPTSKASCGAPNVWHGTSAATLPNTIMISSLGVNIPLVRPGTVSITGTDITLAGGETNANIAWRLNSKINTGLTTNATFSGAFAGVAQDNPSFVNNRPPMYLVGDGRYRVRYWLLIHNAGIADAADINFHSASMALVLGKR